MGILRSSLWHAVSERKRSQGGRGGWCVWCGVFSILVLLRYPFFYLFLGHVGEATPGRRITRRRREREKLMIGRSRIITRLADEGKPRSRLMKHGNGKEYYIRHSLNSFGPNAGC